MRFFKNFYERYICLNLSDYSNLGAELEINKLLFFIFVGICLSVAVINQSNSAIALVLKKLARTGSFSKENGKTLAQLGLGDSHAVKFVLRRNGGRLKSLIMRSGAESNISYEEYSALQKELRLLKKLPDKEQREKRRAQIKSRLEPELDFSTAEFYINSEMKNEALDFIKTKDTSYLKTMLYCLVILAFYLLVAVAMPSILKLINNILK